MYTLKLIANHDQVIIVVGRILHTVITSHTADITWREDASYASFCYNCEFII